MADGPKAFRIPDRTGPELPEPVAGLHAFDVPEEWLKRPKKPKKKPPHKPYVDPPEWLVQVSEMTDELWSEWEWPADDAHLPSVRRKAALILWRRDGNICQLCGLGVDIALRWPHPGSAVVDHLDPMGWGSGYKRERDTWGNVQLAHAHCNSMHHNFDPEMVAVADYRHELQRAIDAADKGRRAPMAPWQRDIVTRAQAGLEPGMDGPWMTEAWRREQELGRPRAPFGQEWPVL